MTFEFSTATKIIFGRGVLGTLGDLVQPFGKKAFVITGKSKKRSEKVLNVVSAAGIEVVHHMIHGEPATSSIQDAALLCKDCNLVIAFGGGSAIDTGKTVAALVTNGGSLMDYLEVIGRGEPLRVPSLPFIAIPTTAGTGAEVTSNAVMESRDHKVKVSLRHPFMFPRVALVDPSLTIDLPPSITASSGLDALTQVLEPYISSRANPFTDLLCEEGLRRAGRSLVRAFLDGHDEAAREDMAMASLFGGMALANARLGAVHGFAGPLGGMYGGGHGDICATLLPHVMSVNLRALKEREPENPVILKFERIGALLTGKRQISAEEGAAFILEMTRKMKIPGLASCGVKKTDFSLIIQKASVSSSMQGNPVRLTHAEMEEVLSLSL